MAPLVQADLGPLTPPTPQVPRGGPPPAPPILHCRSLTPLGKHQPHHIRSSGQACVLSDGICLVALPHLGPALWLGGLWLPEEPLPATGGKSAPSSPSGLVTWAEATGWMVLYVGQGGDRRLGSELQRTELGVGLLNLPGPLFPHLLNGRCTRNRSAH